MQRCVEEILGNLPVTFPSFYHKYTRKKNPTVLDFSWDLCTTVGRDREPLFEFTEPFFWNPAWCKDQVYVDAWTKDGTELMRKAPKVIRQRGTDIKPLENKISNASVGQMPKFSVYTTAQTLCGVTPFFTVHSCTGGRQGGFKDFRTWVDGRSQRSKDHIRGFMYYNHPEAEAKMPATWRTDPFTTDSFRVRSASYKPALYLCIFQLLLPLCKRHFTIASQFQNNQWHVKLVKGFLFLLIECGLGSISVLPATHLDCTENTVATLHKQI